MAVANSLMVLSVAARRRRSSPTSSRSGGPSAWINGTFDMKVVGHELGHYVVGRLCGIAVETFSIGFGPRIFGFGSITSQVPIHPDELQG